MAIIQCPYGHFYDDGKYASCPDCGKFPGYGEDTGEGKTVSLESLMACTAKEIRLTAQELEKCSMRGIWDPQKTVVLSGQGENQKAASLSGQGENTLLLAGWLVCTEGSMRGMDYRLYPGFNRVGRDISSDICVQDPEVSREVHCSVVYEGKKGEFYLVPGRGTVTYLGEEIVQKAVKLEEGSRIRLGGSVLELVPFCKGAHVWEKL